MGAFKTPPQAASPTTIDVPLLQEVVSGLFSDEPDMQRFTVGRFLHPDCRYEDDESRVQGRWTVFQVLRAARMLFDTRVQVGEAYLDATKSRGVVFADLFTRPRVPLRTALLPEARTQCVVRLLWGRQADGSLLVTDVQALVTTQALPSLLGPLGSWAHRQLVQPFGGWALQRIFDAGCFAAAMSHFVNRQLNPFGPKATPTPEYEQELQPVAHAG